MEIDEEYINNVKSFIEQKDAENVKALLTDLHPADIAELCNDLEPEEARFVYRLLDNETAADVLVEMDEDVRKEFLELLPSETIAKRFVDYMDTDDAVDLMRELDEDKQEEVLSHIEDIEQAGDMFEGNASASRAVGRNILCLCHRRRRTFARCIPTEENDYFSFRIEGEACHEERPYFRTCRYSD